MFEPSRLRVARLRRGLTFAALACRTGLSTKSLSAYEHGTTTPEPENVARLVEALGFPESFFRAAPIRAPSAAQASFRSMASMTAAQRDVALAGGALAFEFGDWIAKRYKLPPVELPDLAGQHPDLAAEAVRTAWKLDDKPLRNVVHLLEQHGCRVFSLDGASRAVDAFSTWHDGVPYVFLNTMKSAEHGRIDAAHELGHLVLHRGCDGHAPEHEPDAQRFAAGLLLPRARLLSTVPRAPTIDALIPHKNHWGVSLAAFVYEAHRIGLLTEWQYRMLCIELSKRGYRSREKEGWARETSQVLQKVLTHLRQTGRSLRNVARDLHVEVPDLEAFVFGLALLPMDGGGNASFGGGATKGTLRSV